MQQGRDVRKGDHRKYSPSEGLGTSTGLVADQDSALPALRTSPSPFTSPPGATAQGCSPRTAGSERACLLRKKHLVSLPRRKALCHQDVSHNNSVLPSFSCFHYSSATCKELRGSTKPSYEFPREKRSASNSTLIVFSQTQQTPPGCCSALKQMQQAQLELRRFIDTRPCIQTKT